MHRPGQHWQWRLQHEGPGPHLENQFPAFWNPHRVCRHLHPLGGLASKPQQIWLGSTLSELLLKLHRWLADQLIGKQFIFFFMDLINEFIFSFDHTGYIDGTITAIQLHRPDPTRTGPYSGTRWIRHKQWTRTLHSQLKRASSRGSDLRMSLVEGEIPRVLGLIIGHSA